MLPLIIAVLTVPNMSCTTWGCSPDWAAFVVFDDVMYYPMYLSGHTPPHLDPGSLGPEFRQVSFKMSGSDVGCNYRPTDGHSAELDVGTPLYEVKGYRPEFLLAAIEQDGVVLYQAHYVRSASHGGDLLDIGGKVASIRVMSSSSVEEDATELALIDEPGAVTLITDLILDSPVDYEAERGVEDPIVVEFHLVDGLVIRRVYYAGSGVLSSGIVLSQPARDALSGRISRLP
jgi:hypothetical protein